MRGKRASSIGGGFKAIPHDSVSTQDFYRHISPELPEPVRLRQLLAWCARRTAHAPDWPTELPEHVQKLLSDVYKEAADDVHSALERGEIATSWYHRPAEVEKSEAQVEVRAHPENVANAEARDTLVARIARLQQENDAWVRELRRAGTEHARVLDRLPSRVQTAVLTTRSEPIAQMARPVEQIDWTPATQANEAAAQYVQTGAVDDELQETEAQIARATHELEVRLDAIHVDMHKAHESHKHARSKCARIKSDVGFVFDARRERAQAVATTRPVRKDHDPTLYYTRTMDPQATHQLPQIVCIGDSLTQHGWDVGKRGWTAQLAQTYLRRMDVVNRGLSGFNTRWAKHTVPRIISTQNIRLVCILFGSNDAQFAPGKYHVPVDEFTDNLRDITRMVAGARVLLVTPPPVADRLYESLFEGPADRCCEGTRLYADAVRTLAEELRIPCVDLWTAMETTATSTNTPLDSFLWDGLHLNANGNDLLFNLLLQAIKSNYPELNPDSMPFVVPGHLDFANLDELTHMLAHFTKSQ
ncbi:isoamyl acetate-hydrolyzing esterase [Coemansia sp. RSA 1878]|nr:isoamyl acetate-hydrolyzing esterase [Coemansia sp. RSA 1878]